MPAKLPESAGASKARTSHRVLLCIDDDETQILMQRALLHSKGYDVVVDYRMPDLDGGTVARKLREKSPNVPIVMFTGVDEISPDDLKAVNSLVRKGESPTALSDEVQRLLAF